MNRAMNRARRRRMIRRRRVLGGAALAVVVLVAGAWLALSGGSSSSSAKVATRPARLGALPTTSAPSSTTTTVAAPPAVPAPPYAVGVTRFVAEDPTRPTAARGDQPATSTRRLGLTVRYPAVGAAGAPEAENAAALGSTFPVVVFAHGFAVSAATYADLEREIAAGGFIVVAPDFPLSSSAVAGPASESDIANQAGDVSFLLKTFQAGTGLPAVLVGHVAAGKGGVVGHSDGGSTVAAAAGNSCCVDPRIGAAVVLAGDEDHIGGTWGAAGAAPVLFVQGTADDINPYSFTQQLYDDAKAPKWLVDIIGAGHLEPVTTGSQRPTIAVLIIDFLRAKLNGDAAAAARITPDANVAGVLRLAASA